MTEPTPYQAPRPEDPPAAPDAPQDPPDAPDGTEPPQDTPDAPEPAQEPSDGAQAHAQLAGLLDEAQAHTAGSAAAAAQVPGGLRPLGAILNDAVAALEALKGFL